METELTGLFNRDGRVVGVRARTTNVEMEVHAGLAVGADGRSPRRIYWAHRFVRMADD
jgi:hypothetical protein